MKATHDHRDTSCAETSATGNGQSATEVLMPVVQRRLVLPAVAGRMEGSNADFEHRCMVYLAEEQDKLSPDNGLIALLCDGVRLAREYSSAMQSGQKIELWQPSQRKKTPNQNSARPLARVASGAIVLASP